MVEGLRDVALEKAAGTWRVLPSRKLGKPIKRYGGVTRDLADTEHWELRKDVPEAPPFEVPSLVDTRAALTKIFERHRAKGPPIKVGRQKSGRFDFRSAMRAEARPDDDRAFERTERPRIPQALWVVLNLDYSLSSIFTYGRNLEAVRDLSESLESSGHHSAVVAFNWEARVLKGWTDESVPEEIEYFGAPGSNFEELFRADLRLFDAAGEGQKLLIDLTDGDTKQDVAPFFETFKSEGIRSLALHYRPRSRSLGEDAVIRLFHPSGLIPAVETFVEEP
jgi:hypothetical protein